MNDDKKRTCDKFLCNNEAKYILDFADGQQFVCKQCLKALKKLILNEYEQFTYRKIKKK